MQTQMTEILNYLTPLTTSKPWSKFIFGQPTGGPLI